MNSVDQDSVIISNGNKRYCLCLENEDRIRVEDIEDPTCKSWCLVEVQKVYAEEDEIVVVSLDPENGWVDFAFRGKIVVPKDKIEEMTNSEDSAQWRCDYAAERAKILMG